jgi:hypothetical protein
LTSRKDVIRINQAAADRAEAAAVRDVLRAYDAARREIVATLIDQWAGASILTPQDATNLLRLSGTLAEIEARMAQLGYTTGQIMTTHLTGAGDLAIEQIRREMALLPAEYQINVGMFAGVDTLMIERFVPVAVDEAASITSATASTLIRELRLGLLQGESLPDLTKRLFAATGSSPWRRGQLDAELFTRRVVVSANNGAKEEAIRLIGDTDLQKQAIAVIGDRTTDTCLRVHGQIQPVGEPFTLTGEPRFADKMMTPAFHWNCRTSIAMYHPSFEGSGLNTANMVASAKAELRKRRS